MINSRSEETIWPLPCSFLPGRRERARAGPSWARARRTLTCASLSTHMVTRIHPDLLTHTQPHARTFACCRICAPPHVRLHTQTPLHTLTDTHLHSHVYDCTYTLEVQWTVAVQSLSCVWLCNPMHCSRPGFPVLHHLLEFVQIHVH